MKRTRWPVLVAVISLAAFTACGDDDNDAAGQSAQSGVEADHNQAAAASALTGEELDRAFIEGMVPHHAAAVEMAKVELEKGTRPEVKQLAEAIIEAQEREIAEMTAIAEDEYGFTPDREHEGPMGMLMGVTLSMDMARMAEHVSQAQDVDMAFLAMMRPHHASAIVMADEEMRNGASPQLQEIAEKIIADQSNELGSMQQLLTQPD